MKLLAQGVDIGGQFGSPFGTTHTLGDLVSLIVKISFVISGVLILFLIIFAGFSVIAGAGNNNPEASKRGQQAATAAAAGFAIIFVAYWVVRIIEIITKVNIIS